MLGDLIYEGKGKSTGMRVLDGNGTWEGTSQEQGTLFGMECTSTTTNVNTPQPNGTLYSEGCGMTLTKDGDRASYTILGIYTPKGHPPAGSLRGATFWRTQSPALARLNSIMSVYEVEMSEDWTYSVKEWEWK
jgi:hypothetical protein